jgi:hypothetical protein
MQKEQLLSIDCISFEVSARVASTQSLQLFEYSGSGYDYGIPLGRGRFKIVNENVLVERILNEGNGINFESKVFFKEEFLNGSVGYLKFKKVYDKTRVEIEEKLSSDVDLFLIKHVEDLYAVPVVKSIYRLYQVGLFSSDRLIEKLKSYLREEEIAEMVSLMNVVKLAV